MKTAFIFLIAFIGFINVSRAQLEVTTNPLVLLFNYYTLTVDYNINKDFSFGVLSLLVIPKYVDEHNQTDN